jgi:hypothetical protein
LPFEEYMKKSIQCAAVIALSTLTFLAAALRANDRIPVRVVVAAFDNELQNWITNFPLDETLPFTQGYLPLHYNSRLRVLGIITGEGKSHAAASIMGLDFDPRFKLSLLLAGSGHCREGRGSFPSSQDVRNIPAIWRDHVPTWVKGSMGTALHPIKPVDQDFLAE